MNVTLSERNQAIVRARLKSGLFKTADEVVNDIIEQYMLEVGYNWEEIEEALLISVKQPTTPYEPGVFRKMIDKMIEEDDRKKSPEARP